MVDILHRIAIEDASLGDVYTKLTAPEGLAEWWTRETSTVGEILQFRFDIGGFDMRVVEASPTGRIVWEVIDGPDEWVGTHVEWTLRQDGGYVVVEFAHTGWREPVAFMAHCSTKWATFLMSLKALVETGKGAPHPDDVRISDWH